MSSFIVNAQHRKTGATHEIWCHDDYFGKHEYGYLPNIEGGKHLTEKEFRKEYRVIEKSE